MGLIAGKRFQDPLRNGAVSLFGSTHKTFPGPQGGIILSNAEDGIIRKLDWIVDPVIYDNYHQHRMAALAIVAAEMIEFGEEYASQVIKNAKALGGALYEAGFDVLCSHKGFTESHQILVNVRKLGIDGAQAARTLSSENIVTNNATMPDDVQGVYGGLRLGTSELTRVGMKESEMKHTAELIKKCLISKVDPKIVREEVVEFKKQYTKMHFSVDNGQYAYVHP